MVEHKSRHISTIVDCCPSTILDAETNVDLGRSKLSPIRDGDAAGRAARILIVEDDSRIAAMNSEHLQGCGYDVLVAASIREATAALMDQPPDLVILDVMLPDGSGFDFCRQVSKYSSAPVLMLTCLDDAQAQVQGFKEGADDYITKPYDITVLEMHVAALLRRGSWGMARSLELPPLQLDLASGTCELDGQLVRLTAMELRLLYYLAANHGKRIRRERIYEDVWRQSSGKSTHTLAEHISRLRSKLDMENPQSVFTISCEGAEYIF
jgi:DNA-binding response OmpR family regulator